VKARPLPPPPPPCAQFGGFYVGGNVGWVFSEHRWNDLDALGAHFDPFLPREVHSTTYRSCVSVQLREYQSVMIAEMKARQSAKIRELKDALIDAGFLTLNEQATALRLSRSTTWTIVKANHKASGLSATTINRMLMSPQLPTLARAKILEYVQEKSAGLHGHNPTQLRRFTARLSIERPETGLRRSSGAEHGTPADHPDNDNRRPSQSRRVASHLER
jgi:hypothetical protein